MGHEVDVLVISHKDHVEHQRGKLPHVGNMYHATAAPEYLRLGSISALIKALWLCRKADVVISGVEIGRCLHVAALAAKITRTPLAVTVQNNLEYALSEYVPEGFWTQFTLWCFRQADVVNPVSEKLGDQIRNSEYTGSRVKVVTNGIDLIGLRDEPEMTRSPSKVESSGPILAMGRLTQQKGFDLLLKAFAKVCAAGETQRQLVIAGAGEDEFRLKRLAVELGVSEFVQFPGFVDNPAELYIEASLFVLSSRFEGYSLVLVEALIMGLPIISFDCDFGPSEVLQDGRYGRLVQNGDINELSAAITGHFQNPEELTLRAIRGQATCCDRFDPDKSAAKHLEILEALY